MPIYDHPCDPNVTLTYYLTYLTYLTCQSGTRVSTLKTPANRAASPKQEKGGAPSRTVMPISLLNISVYIQSMFSVKVSLN